MLTRAAFPDFLNLLWHADNDFVYQGYSQRLLGDRQPGLGEGAPQNISSQAGLPQRTLVCSGGQNPVTHD